MSVGMVKAVTPTLAIGVEAAGVLVSFGALLVAGVALGYARLQTRAARVQAQAAREQAEAAREQADSSRAAASEAAQSSKVTELAVLNEFQISQAERLPRVHAGIERPYVPFQVTKDGEVLDPPPEAFDRLDDWKYSIHTFVNGVLVNESSRAVLVEGEPLRGGTSTLFEGGIPEPLRFDDRGAYLLQPGQAATFRLDATDTVRNYRAFVEAGSPFDNDSFPCLPYARFVIRYASSYDGEYVFASIMVKLERAPVYMDEFIDKGRLRLMSVQPGYYILRKTESLGSLEDVRRKVDRQRRR